MVLRTLRESPAATPAGRTHSYNVNGPGATSQAALDSFQYLNLGANSPVPRSFHEDRNEYSIEEGIPPYNEFLHELDDVISFDPRHLPCLRINIHLVRGKEDLLKHITALEEKNILPRSVDLWRIAHIHEKVEYAWLTHRDSFGNEVLLKVQTRSDSKDIPLLLEQAMRLFNNE